MWTEGKSPSELGVWILLFGTVWEKWFATVGEVARWRLGWDEMSFLSLGIVTAGWV